MHELTKREILVFVYLVMCENTKTGRCNPSRSMISKALNMPLPHVSVAIPGLGAKGWIVEDVDGNFGIIPIEKVTESVSLEVTKSVTPEVTKSVTRPKVTKSVNEVTKSVTKVTKSVSAIYKDLKQTRTDNEQKEITPAASKKGKRIANDFVLTDEMREYAARKRPDVNAALETEKFINFWKGKPGKDGTKLDWPATWRNWILNAREGRQHVGRNVETFPKAIPAPAPAPATIEDEPAETWEPRPPDPCDAGLRSLWADILAGLRSELSGQIMKNWIDPIIFDGLDDTGRLKLRAGPVAVDWVTRYYAPALLHWIAQIGFTNGFTWEIEDEGHGYAKAN